MSEQIRSFLAISIPDQLKLQIKDYVQDLKKIAPHIRWTKTENLHLTLKFLGEQPTKKIDQLIASTISTYAGYGSIKISTKEFGGFPNKKQARVFWLGVESDPVDSIKQLYNQIQHALEPLGFPIAEKTYKAHLTLGRNKERKKCQQLWTFIQENPFQQFSFTTQRLLLMRSEFTKDGPYYSVLQNFSLQ